MSGVTVLVFHALPGPGAGPRARLLAEARRRLTIAQRPAWLAAGAAEVRLLEDPPDDLPFGRRLATAAAELLRRQEAGAPYGAVVAGSGALPLARRDDLRRFVEAAAGSPGTALANNAYSADVVAVARLRDLAAVPDLPADNALPRWLAERAGVRVADLRRRWRLQFDLDSPADLLLLAAAGRCPRPLRPYAAALAEDGHRLRERAAGIRAVLADPQAELVLAGRTSAATLAGLERAAACRVRAFVEERGLRAGSPLALAASPPARGPGGAPRPPRSLLGELLDRDGPRAIGPLLARLGDGAVVDSRVLLAHRCGSDEAAWPEAEDRFAADLLDGAAIRDPWLRDLVASAADAPIPILLGGHSLVGPGLRLLIAAGTTGRPTTGPA